MQIQKKKTCKWAYLVICLHDFVYFSSSSWFGSVLIFNAINIYNCFWFDLIKKKFNDWRWKHGENWPLLTTFFLTATAAITGINPRMKKCNFCEINVIKKERCNVGFQYRRGGVGRGIKPLSYHTPQPPPTHAQRIKSTVLTCMLQTNGLMDQRTNRWTDKASFRVC